MSPIFSKGIEEVIGIHKCSDEEGLNNFGDCIGPIYQHFQSLQRTKKLKTFFLIMMLKLDIMTNISQLMKLLKENKRKKSIKAKR